MLSTPKWPLCPGAPATGGTLLASSHLRATIVDVPILRLRLACGAPTRTRGIAVAAVAVFCTGSRLRARRACRLHSWTSSRHTLHALDTFDTFDVFDDDDSGSDDDDDEEDDSSIPDRGLGLWRAVQGWRDQLTVPTILFPITDLLLIGHTKRMHLFEPRWVDMVDTAVGSSCGVIGLVYIHDARGGVALTATLAEVIACSNLGSAGRMVTVRGVARAKLLGLSEAVAQPGKWGVAVVSELPEIQTEDCSSGGVAALAAELAQLTRGLDLSMPGTESEAPAGQEDAPAPEGAAASGGEPGDGEDEPDAPELWTHERPPTEEAFGAQPDADRWEQELQGVGEQLQDVPLSCAEKVECTGELREAVATLYAVLGKTALETRIELFQSPEDVSLEQRLQQLTEMLSEKQGMARARRAIAAALDTGGDSKGSGSSDGEEGKGAEG